MVELLAALSAASSDESCRSSADDPAKEASRLSSLGPMIAEIERAFEEISRLAFKRQMPLPVITVQSKGRSSSIGWFWQEKWQNDQPKRLPEINLCPEYLGRSVEDIAEVLIHEMSHYANYLDGIRDCSSSQYHNRHFKRRCDLVGLLCTKGKRGWAYTELSPQLRDLVLQINLNPDVFKMYRVAPEYLLVAAKPERRLRRYTCACQKADKPKAIYASRGLDATCNKCLRPYTESPLG